MSIFYTVFGRLLASTPGLRIANLPSKLSPDAIRAICASANAQVESPADEPYALVVTSNEKLRIELMEAKTINQTVAFRKGDRLFLIADGTKGLASIDKSVQVILDESYPEKAQHPITISELAKELGAETVRAAGLSVESREIALLSDSIQNVLETLSDIHKRMSSDSAVDWNLNWFVHASKGVTNLVTALRSKIKSQPNLTLEEFGQTYTFAAFGLPAPTNRKKLKNKTFGIGQDYENAVASYWADEGHVAATLVHLSAKHDSNLDLPIHRLDWNTFDQKILSNDSVPLAFLDLVSSASDAFELFAQFDEDDFFHPLPRNLGGEIKISRSEPDESLRLPEIGQSNNLHYAKTGSFSTSSTGSITLTSEQLLIEIPTLQAISAEDLAKSRLLLNVGSSNKTRFVGISEISENGALYFRGVVEYEIGKEPYKAFGKHHQVSISIAPGDILFSQIDIQARTFLLILPQYSQGALVAEIKSGNKVGKWNHIGPESAELESEEFFTFEIGNSNNNHFILMWGEDVIFENEVLEALDIDGGVFFQSLNIHSSLEFRIAESTYQITTAVIQEHIESPIHAAAKKAKLTNELPSETNKNSLLGKLDARISTIVGAGGALQNTMHFILPADSEIKFDELTTTRDKYFVSEDSTYQAFKVSADFDLSAQFTGSDEVANFFEAFEALEVSKLLKVRTGTSAPDWPSRTSWETLWTQKHKELENYLDAFSEMVEAAKKTLNPADVFWASYPFSASVWATQSDGKCLAVLLSPLHPIRLAWLASTEWTLRHADSSVELAGSIEAWNLPAIGPGPNANSNMLAVPSDSGVGQVFLGWTVLGPASISGFESVKIPMRIAGLESPGGGASGLNKNSVTSALIDYRRVNPHVATLTIDIASSVEMPRLREIDESILETVRTWSLEKDDSLAGGLRVWDSLNRGGAAPIFEVNRVAGNLSSSPFVWMRYKHQNGATKKCNLRLLQDSGLRFEIGSGSKDSGGALGLIGEIPLRRFESGSSSPDGALHSESSPSIAAVSPQSSFSRALSCLERRNDRTPLIKSKLSKALLVDENADWSVSGEAMVSPSGIASLLSNEGGGQLLWEWRPPLLDTKGEVVLEKRPFISVARIPSSFKSQVKGLLESATGRPSSNEFVEKILNKLGGRGVGLSSLLAMGGTHSAGALGFFLSLALLDQVQDSNIDYLVMPIDACDSFIRTLTGNKIPAEVTQRADLLVIAISDSDVTFTPLEVKFYGLASGVSQTQKLPAQSDSSITEAKTQAFETLKILEFLASRYKDATTEFDTASRVLWLNAFTAFIEAAAKLNGSSDRNSERFVSRLQKILAGEVSVKTGRPLVNYFGVGGIASGSRRFSIERSSEQSQWGLFSANASLAFEVTENQHPEIRESLIELVRWATHCESSADETEQSGVADGATNLGGGTESEASEENKEEPVDEESQTEGEAQDFDDQPDPVEDSAPKKVEDYAAPSWLDEYPTDDGVRVRVGTSVGTLASVNVDFWPGNTNLTQMNMGVVGNLGTGKTQFLLSLVTQLRYSADRAQSVPLNFLIFDYKRDYTTESFIKKVGGKVLSPEKKIPLNVLALTGDYSKSKAYKRAKAFCDVLAKIYGGIGPVQKQLLTTTIVDLFETGLDHRAPLLSEVRGAYDLAAGKPDAVSSILSGFVDGEVFEFDRDKILSFKELMDGNVVVVSLNEFRADSDSKNALVVLMLDLYYEYMLASKKWPFEGTTPQIRTLNSFLLVDEATNIMKYDFPVLSNILLEGREWGFGTILASQYLSHFKTKENNYGEPLKTWVIHQVPSAKLQELHTLGMTKATQELATSISDMKKHHSIYDSYGYQSQVIRDFPFFELFQKPDTDSV